MKKKIDNDEVDDNGVDGAEIHALLMGLGILLAGHRANAERLVDAGGAKYETTEIIRSSDEGITLVEKLMDMLFDFSEQDNCESIDDENRTD